jgi:hypothetical protein
MEHDHGVSQLCVPRLEKVHLLPFSRHFAHLVQAVYIHTSRNNMSESVNRLFQRYRTATNSAQAPDDKEIKVRF